MKKIDLPLRSIYSLFFLLFVFLFLSINPNFREDDWGAIRKILYPQYYSNPEFFYIDLSKYNPYYAHYYLSAFVVRLLGCEDNFAVAGKIFWFVEHGLIAALVVVLANYFFRRDKLISVLTFLWTVFYSPTPWSEPKFAATILMLLAMYFYFQKRLFFSAFFTATVFYFHVGFATWWFLTFLFVLAWLWLQNKEITFVQCVKHALTIIIFAFPVMWTYAQRMADSRVDAFTNLYAFYSMSYQVSPLLAFQYAPSFIISRILSIALVLLSVKKAGELGLNLNRIRPVAWGVISLMVTQFIFGDLLKIMAVSKIQLVRAPVITDILWPILIGFLIANQIRQRKYFFGVLLLVILWGYNLAPQILGWDMYFAFNIFCILLIGYEFFEKLIDAFWDRTGLSVPKALGRFFHPMVLLALSALVLVVKLPFIKPMVKIVLNRPEDPVKLERQQKKGAYLDIFNYMNKNLPYGPTAFLFPFFMSYHFNYTHHNIFNINCDTPINSLFYNNESSSQFREVYENDLKCTIEKTFVEKDPACSWEMLWKNLDEPMLRSWKAKYGLTHVAREQELPLKLPVVYENEFYVLYAVQ